MNEWYGIPLSCIECPIRQVQVTCRLNMDHKFWDRRRKRKWPIATTRLLNRGLVIELCRKTNCNPEYIKHLMTSRDHKCVCSTPLSPVLSTVPFSSDNSEYFNGDEINKLEYPYWVQEYMQKKPKTPKKLSGEWLDNLYELYNSCGGIDDFECLIAQQDQPLEPPEVECNNKRMDDDGNYWPTKSSSKVSKGSKTSTRGKSKRKSRKSVRIKYPTEYRPRHTIHRFHKRISHTNIPKEETNSDKEKRVKITGV